MVKKKISGQTLAIIILAVLLLLTIGFGGVFAYYSARSKKVSGKIEMANLKITMSSGGSDKSEIVISNGRNVVPGQALENSPLTIQNLSSTTIYLVVVYKINAEKDNGQIVTDSYTGAVIDLDVEYINPLFPSCSSNRGVKNYEWVDYVFEADSNDENANSVIVDNEVKGVYRCLVSAIPFNPTQNDDPITVIGENKMSLSGDMGNDYQSTSITFTFQAYAIGGNTFNGQFYEGMPAEERCETIVDAIYRSQGNSFFKID